MSRMTTARALIYETLETTQEHMTAYQVFDAVKPRLPSLNMSTVYRSLEYLTHEGLISVADVGEGMPIYEAVSNTHHHLVCEGCKKILIVEHEQVKGFFEKISQEYDFTIHTNHLILFGLCEKCRRAKENQSEELPKSLHP
ncbi:MAG: transcriptional repressor [Anaerolineales bacterium]|nr:transcriptional repressor [Anaerolineales bacterium]